MVLFPFVDQPPLRHFPQAWGRARSLPTQGAGAEPGYSLRTRPLLPPRAGRA
jgi:hypothetical protein